MRIEQKQILKDDGRYLVFYHFPDTASEEQTAVYEEISTAEQPGLTDSAESTTASLPENKDKSRV